MLIEFSVANFRSIRERVTLSMMATDEEGVERNVIQPHGLLNSAVIYGANASGKSNMLKALEFLVRFVRTAHLFQQGNSIAVLPFRLDAAFEQQMSEFEVLFFHDGMKYAYGIKVDQEKVHEEYLYEYPGDMQTLIFERTGTSVYEFGVEEQEQEVLSKRTPENVLYLAKATQFNFGKVSKAFDWFQQRVECWVSRSEPNHLFGTEKLFVKNERARDLIKNVFSVADFGIQDIVVQQLDSSSDGRWKAKVNQDGTVFLGARILDDIDFYRVELMRSREGNGVSERVLFQLEEESEGTKRLFKIIGPWIEVLESGSLLIVDELENSLHPLIVEQLVKLFHEPQNNPKGAQLIFSTHNTNLLDTALFRRDQIWFTEKDQSNAGTDLYSLAEFTPRESEDIEKGYLLGRYGAIPFFGKEFLF